MISREQVREDERKYYAKLNIIEYYQDKHNNARIPLKALAYEFVWRLLKKREVFEVVDILSRAMLEDNFRGYSITEKEKRMIGEIYRKALKTIAEERLA